MSEKEEIRRALAKLLEQHKILPHTDWENFEVHHANQESRGDKKIAYEAIRKNVKGKHGVYVYEKDRRILYVGRGSDIERRLKRHYRESFHDSRNGRTHFSKTHCAFFSKHTGRLKVYWKECGDEESRRAYEGMLIFALQPTFELFRESRKSKGG